MLRSLGLASVNTSHSDDGRSLRVHAASGSSTRWRRDHSCDSEVYQKSPSRNASCRQEDKKCGNEKQMTRALKSGNLSHFVIRLLCLLCCLGNAFGFPQNFTPNSIGSHLITSCVLDTSGDNTFQFLTTGPLGPQVPKCTDPVCDGCVPWTAIHPLDDLAEHWPHCFYSDLSASFCELMPRAFENPKTNSAGFRADLSACEVTESSFEVLTDARPIGSTLAIYEVQQTQAKTGFCTPLRTCYKMDQVFAFCATRPTLSSCALVSYPGPHR